MGRIRTTIEKNYTIVHNEYLRDPNIGYAEIGVLTVMLSLPDNWNFSVNALVHRFGNNIKSADGKYKIGEALKKLCKIGYFNRCRNTQKGKFAGYSYIFSDELDKKSGYSKNFTVMNNDYLRDPELGIEEIGLLTVMLSLPDDWNFSIEGLVHRFGKSVKCPDGEFKVRTLLKKLNKAGYFRRIRLTDEKGKVVDWIYEFSDTSCEDWISDRNVTERIENEAVTAHVECLVITAGQTDISDPITEVLKRNIGYDKLCLKHPKASVDMIISILVSVIKSGKGCRISKQKYSSEEVRSYIYKLESENISDVIESMQYARKIKYPVPYLLTALYNSLYKDKGTNAHSYGNIREILSTSDRRNEKEYKGGNDFIMDIIRGFSEKQISCEST